jgi:hypothetical protein
MTSVHTLLRGASCLVLGAALSAQAEQSAPANPADAAAAVPATRHEPALPYRPLPPASASADQNWKMLNGVVAGYDAMSLTMDERSGHGHSPAAAPVADPHAGHPAPPAAARHARHRGAMK